MEGIVEENGQVDPLSVSPESPIVSTVQSVIQANQQSVIQTPANIQLTKSNVILLSKPNSVIQTTQGSLSTLPTIQAFQVVEQPSDGDESFSDEESPKKRRDILTRRPSYRKILNDLGGGEIAEPKVEQTSSEGDSESSHSIPYHTVLPGTAIQISSGDGGQGIHTLTMTNSTAGGAIVQYAQGQEFFVPGGVAVVTPGSNLNSSSGGGGGNGGNGSGGGGGGGEDQVRKREMRLLKNREAARECRRKKKEYIKCLENRVAVLENQNKTLIDELKTLKELYCQTKTE